jgi:uncharacterized protein YunC (DUF1805 family)
MILEIKLVYENLRYTVLASCAYTTLRLQRGAVQSMMRVEPILLEGHTAIAIEVKLPKTTLLVVTTDKGYIMCGALDVALLNERLRDRNIVAARATGVRTIEELLESPLESVTHTAEDLGIVAGMTGREAILKMM